jgi:hypothetical protein
VEEPEDDERMSWVVSDEGKGLDLVIEVLHKGDRDKDLVQNVERYAHLGIPEYFVYDRGRQQIHGFHLSAPSSSGGPPKIPAAGRYQRIVPQLGHYRSRVLGLDLAIIGNALRFLAGEAVLPGSADVLRRIQGMMGSLESKAEQAEEARDATQARAVLTVLRVRGIAVADTERARILAETDVERLERWLEKAVAVGSLAEVLAEPSGG